MNRKTLLIAVLAGPLLLAGLAAGQGRGAIGVTNPSRPGNIDDFGAGTFRQHSYGLGTTSRGAPTGVLGQSLSAGSLSIPRGPAGAAPSSLGGFGEILGPGAGVSEMLYRPQGLGLTAEDSAGRGGLTIDGSGQTGIPAGWLGDPAAFSRLGADEQAVGLAMARAFGIDAALPSAAQEPVTSLAPAEDAPGLYARFMREGEQAFRQGDYAEAEHRFTMTLDIARRSPETLLSLVHASAAQGRYPLSSYYLRRAIGFLPELPLVPLAVREFFGDSEEFEIVIEQVHRHLGSFPDDPPALFTLAYLLWFDGQFEPAAQALRQAAEAGPDPLLTEGLHAFWAGCVASGQVQGTLPPPRPTAEPALRAD